MMGYAFIATQQKANPALYITNIRDKPACLKGDDFNSINDE